MHCSWRKRRSLTCKRERDFADFVQEERAAVGGLEAAFALGMRAGEGAFFVPEQFAFQKRLRDGAAIDGDKRPVFARAALVDGPRRHFLAGAAFAQEEGRARRSWPLCGWSQRRVRMAGLVPSMPSKVLPASICCICADFRVPGRRHESRA